MAGGKPEELDRDLRCPACKAEKPEVIDTRERGDSLTVRLKQCRSCGKRFKTWEEIEAESNNTPTGSMVKP